MMEEARPVTLPIKFPLLLVHGVEGICWIIYKNNAYNFNELIDLSIKVLKGIKPRIYPDFQTGGLQTFLIIMTVKEEVKLELEFRISQIDKNTLHITEIPFSTTTTSLINSILKS